MVTRPVEEGLLTSPERSRTSKMGRPDLCRTKVMSPGSAMATATESKWHNALCTFARAGKKKRRHKERGGTTSFGHTFHSKQNPR